MLAPWSHARAAKDDLKTGPPVPDQSANPSSYSYALFHQLCVNAVQKNAENKLRGRNRFRSRVMSSTFLLTEADDVVGV